MEELSQGRQLNRVHIRFGRVPRVSTKLSAKQRRELQREFIREETERFIANGGEIEVLPASNQEYPWSPAFLDVYPE